MDDFVRPLLNLVVLLQNLGFRGCQDAIEALEYREWQYHLPVFVPLVRPSEQVADAPDEGGKLLVGLDGHGST